MAQISAEEIKDTRVVYMEIEAQNLDKKVLIFFKIILHASLVVRFCAFFSRNLFCVCRHSAKPVICV